MNYTSEKGFVIVAFNTSTVNYVECAIALAKSVKHFHPDSEICLITNEACGDKIFDYEKVCADRGGFLNDIYAYSESPFHETVKLEADMLLTSPFDHWWTYFRNYDVYVSTGCRNYKSEISDERYYRKLIDANRLPDVYNAITYWRVSPVAKTFFSLVNSLLQNWTSVQEALLYAKNEKSNTDLAYAVAIDMIGREKFTGVDGPKIVHMKPRINDIRVNEWQDQLVYEVVQGQVRLNGYTQNGLLHYQVKTMATEFGKYYE